MHGKRGRSGLSGTICLTKFVFCRTPSPDMHLTLKSPSGKPPTKRGSVQPREMDSVVSLFAGGYALGSRNSSLELTTSNDLSSAARCHPYTAYDRDAKFKVFILLQSSSMVFQISPVWKYMWKRRA